MAQAKSRKKKSPKRILALPDLEHAKSAVLSTLTSRSSQRTYDHATVAMLIGCGLRRGRIWGDGMSPKVLWDVVRAAAAQAGIEKLAPHDLRRTCARLCHLAGGELEQTQFLLGHVSVQTTERYLGCKQKLRCAVNDRIDIEPDAAA